MPPCYKIYTDRDNIRLLGNDIVFDKHKVDIIIEESSAPNEVYKHFVCKVQSSDY